MDFYGQLHFTLYTMRDQWEIIQVGERSSVPALIANYECIKSKIVCTQMCILMYAHADAGTFIDAQCRCVCVYVGKKKKSLALSRSLRECL